jgi:hypothetical protein
MGSSPDRVGALGHAVNSLMVSRVLRDRTASPQDGAKIVTNRYTGSALNSFLLFFGRPAGFTTHGSGYQSALNHTPWRCFHENTSIDTLGCAPDHCFGECYGGGIPAGPRKARRRFWRLSSTWQYRRTGLCEQVKRRPHCAEQRLQRSGSAPLSDRTGFWRQYQRLPQGAGYELQRLLTAEL